MRGTIKTTLFERAGFTLAELLIALAILAIIATFTIPKLLVNQQNQKRNAIFKEVIASLSQLATNANYAGVTTTTDFRAFTRKNLNYIKLSTASDPYTEGCWSVSGGGFADAYLLPNGAMIDNINGPSGFINGETIDIDWNGLQGPNTVGIDIINVYACFQNCKTDGMISTTNTPYLPGTVGPTGLGNEQSIQDIFK